MKQGRAGRRREAALRTLLVACGIAAALGVAELAARALWTAPWWERLGEERVRSGYLGFRKNALGLRDRDYGSKPPGRRRVLILGDSFTQGFGVIDPSQIFPEILERRLGEMERFAGGVDVLNGGMSGSHTDDWLRLLRQAVPAFQPDVVLIVFFLRDGTLLAVNEEFFAPIRRQIALRNRDSLAYRGSFLVRVLRDRLDRRTIGQEYTRELVRSYLGDEEQTAEWSRAMKNLEHIRDEARQAGARVGFAIFPILADLDDSYPFQGVCDLIEAWARDSLRVPVHDLLPAFLGMDGADLWVSVSNQHPNPRAHAIAAESLLPFAVDLLSGEADRESVQRSNE